MTPESLAALGARLLLMQRFPYLPVHAVAAMSDDAAIAVAAAAFKAESLVLGGAEKAGGQRD